VEVAKPAFPFLDIGLDDVAAVAHPLVARIALLQFLGDEELGLAGHHLLAEAGLDLVVQGLVAPQIARFEDRGADRMIARRLADHLVDRPAREADLQAEIPKQIEHRLDHLLGPAGRFPGRDEGDVDIRI
jgi:hypothetical protein